MTDLRKAAEAVLERWDSPAWEWKRQGPTADLMANLRKALAAEQPKPEPVAWFLPQPLEVHYYSAKNQALQREIEALRPDAERYRYLRNRDPAEVLSKEGKDAGCWIDCEEKGGIAYKLQLLTGDDADAAIDAAMKEDKT